MTRELIAGAVAVLCAVALFASAVGVLAALMGMIVR
jgi:hypothetical protein